MVFTGKCEDFVEKSDGLYRNLDVLDFPVKTVVKIDKFSRRNRKNGGKIFNFFRKIFLFFFFFF